MNQIDAHNLLEKYRAGICTDEELAILENWYKDLQIVPFSDISQSDMESDLQEVYAALPLQNPERVKLWPRIAAAVAVVTILFSAGLFYFSREKVSPENVTSLVKDVSPGKQGATLTLANGKKIKLAEAVNGELAKEAGVVISKAADGQLVYHVAQTSVEANTINTLSTENGETYIVVLPDESKVWLNSASVLKYPANFLKNGKRIVELSGEAYFEIAKDTAHPFVVKTNQQEVEVLGTHFNISAYADDASTKTTLLEGSVNVTSLQVKRQSQLLKPNQQAELSGRGLTVSNIEAEYAVAWKKGFFMFDDERLETAMIRIARWYNVQVVYDDEQAKGGNYFGRISRYENISKVLHMLSKTDLIKFKIEGNKVRISKKK